MMFSKKSKLFIKPKIYVKEVTESIPTNEYVIKPGDILKIEGVFIHWKTASGIEMEKKLTMEEIEISIEDVEK